MKKLSAILLFNSLILILPVFAEGKISGYFRAGSASSNLDLNLTEGDVYFGGFNNIFSAKADFEHVVAEAKAKFSLTKTNDIDNLKAKGNWEKAYVAFDLPIFNPIRIWGGHGMPLALTGSYLTLVDSYFGSYYGARWIRDGIALQYRNEVLSAGAGLHIGEDEFSIKNEFKAGSALQFDFSKYEVPLQLGASAVFQNPLDGGTTISYRDWTFAAMGVFKAGSAFSLSAGYAFNSLPVTRSVAYKWVENYLAISKYCHLATFNLNFKISSLSFIFESEGGKEFDGDYWSAYTGLRVKIPLNHIIAFEPTVQFFSIFNTDDDSLSRETLSLFPRLVFKSGHHQIMFGKKFEYRAVGDYNHHWVLRFPCYYRYNF